MFAARESLFECCNPLSAGEPEYLSRAQHISARPVANLVENSSGNLKLFYEKWRSDRHAFVRAAVVVHAGETDHSGWYNGLAVRLTDIGCSSYVLDAQGFGQSDGARGYFESFDELVCDYIDFCRLKWTEVADAQSKNATAPMPGLVLIGKGFGALVVMRALVELHPTAANLGFSPVVVLISPAFQFGSFIAKQCNVSCHLNSGQCARQPAAQCARVSASMAFTPQGEEGQHQKLDHASNWFPKMIITEPVDPDMVSRDPQTIDRMSRDDLCWRQGYRARVLAELVSEQERLPDLIANNREVYMNSPALILHGSGDKLFSAAGSHGLHSVWCDATQQTGTYPRLKIYDGAFHQLLQEPNKDEVVNDLMLFVASKVTV